MGYRGFFRSVGAAVRQAERDAKKRQRELEKQQKLLAKMEAIEKTEYEVEVHANRIHLIRSLHKECGDTLNWEKIKNAKPPKEPVQRHTNEEAAQKAYDNFKPGIFNKLLGSTEKKKAQLHAKIAEARRTDSTEYTKEYRDYTRTLADWKKMVNIATRVLNRETEAFIDIIKEEDPFEEIKHIGTEIKIDKINKDMIIVSAKVYGKDAIPSDIKKLLKSGKLSVKPMPKSQFYALYQDYVCSCALRIGRELFALLPINATVVNTYVRMLNTATGHKEDTLILSVLMNRDKMNAVNFASIDPSDAMQNFQHNMNFKSNKGFAPVEALNP